jgi:hypothetical protein
MKDFDLLLNERREKGHSFKMFGEVYYIPPSIPYDAVLRFRALGKRGATDTVSDDETFDLFESLVGSATLSELRKHSEFDVEIMTTLMQHILEIYGVTNTAGATESPKGKKAAR